MDVGPVWATEIRHAAAAGLDVDVVEPGEGLDQRGQINYFACRLKRARHPENGDRFLDFLASAEAREIYEEYGFVGER